MRIKVNQITVKSTVCSNLANYNEIYVLLVLCEGNPLVISGFRSQKGLMTEKAFPRHGINMIFAASDVVKFQEGVIKWKHFPRYWPFVWGIHRSPVNSPHKGQWHGTLMFSLICARTNGWVNNRDNGDLRRHHTLYDVTVMFHDKSISLFSQQACVKCNFSHIF